MKDFKYKVKIYTNQKTVEFKTDDISPANIENVVDIEQFDGDFVTYGEIVDLATGEIKTLSDDGHYVFV